MPTTYTVYWNGDARDASRGLSVAQAAVEMLTDDAHDYEIRREDDGRGWRLWTRQQVGGRPWTKTVVFSLEDDEAVATAEIYQRVVDFTGRDGGSWAGDCMTDADYDAMMADLVIDEAVDDLLTAPGGEAVYAYAGDELARQRAAYTALARTLYRPEISAAEVVDAVQSHLSHP